MVERGIELLRSWGLVVEVGKHAFGRLGHYLAGSDEQRLADLNDAFRDPGVRSIITTRGGKGSSRIAEAIDFGVVSRDPKPLIGFSDITFLHLALTSTAAWRPFMGPAPCPSIGPTLRKTPTKESRRPRRSAARS
jgi:muramoyltetrapeptide carboxypeptidase